MPKPKLKFLLKEGYLKTIKNSIGTKMFRNSFYIIGGKRTDIFKNGKLSCAIYVSGILYIFKLVQDVHATVDSTVKDLEMSGWQRAVKCEPGNVLIWQSLKSKNGSEHKHIGFCIGPKEAISNNSKLGYPIKHHITFGAKNGQPVRKIEAIYKLSLNPKRG